MNDRIKSLSIDFNTAPTGWSEKLQILESSTSTVDELRTVLREIFAYVLIKF